MAGPAQQANRRFESCGQAQNEKRPAVPGVFRNGWAVKGESGRLANHRFAPGRTPCALRMAGPAQQANRRFESCGQAQNEKRPAVPGVFRNWWAVKDSNLGPID
jgi:hypothetical protein